ncbi:unnamed protein product [Sphagnum jensenii]|uniref:ABC transporter domain-containing protein n=1 Tax=Sphagnum jensenii TaxID=128206 RepID=A0ABP1B7H4_9BRYO
MTRRKDRYKTILKGVSGVVSAGEMLAMLGPSGSGKTTLLNILKGEKQLKAKKQLQGKILYNNKPHSKAIKRITAFVAQDDVLFPHLTVKETLFYAALLRLPRSYSQEQKERRVEAIIAELGLEKCQHTMIGNTFLRGVSGGERKRVSIGHEMLVDPSLLLLDEPTSGLDSTTASRIIVTLQELARGGRTIITTIHQPSSRIFQMFDKLILLSGGQLLYYGRANAAMAYFTSLGFAPSFATNPADFLLDLANGVAPDFMPVTEESLAEEAEGEEGRTKQTQTQQPLRETLIEAYKANLAQKTSSEQAVLTEGETQALLDKRKWPTTWQEQFRVLVVRGLKERRHEAFAGLRVGQVLAISIICGLLWWQTSTDRIQDQVGLLFFISTFWGFFPLFSAIFTFPQERAMLLKERGSGMYRLSAYFFARMVGDLPLELALPTTFVTIVYWMGGLKPTPVGFFLTLAVVLYNVLVSQGLGLALGAALMDVKQATTMASVIMLTFLLASGYYVQVTPAWIGWLKYVSFSYYCFKLQLASQYSQNQTYPCPTGRCLVKDYPAIHVVGLDHIGLAAMAMAIMLIAYRFLTYIALMRIKGYEN